MPGAQPQAPSEITARRNSAVTGPVPVRDVFAKSDIVRATGSKESLQNDLRVERWRDR